MATGSPAKSSRPPIGNYEILAHVATGGMGAVYKAMDTRLGREVALKVLLPDQAAQKPLLLKRFRLEARYGGQLSHENIVTLYEYGETHGHSLPGARVRRWREPATTISPRRGRWRSKSRAT